MIRSAMQPMVFVMIEKDIDHNNSRMFVKFSNTQICYDIVLDLIESIPVVHGGTTSSGLVSENTQR